MKARLKTLYIDGNLNEPGDFRVELRRWTTGGFVEYVVETEILTDEKTEGAPTDEELETMKEEAKKKPNDVMFPIFQWSNRPTLKPFDPFDGATIYKTKVKKEVIEAKNDGEAIRIAVQMFIWEQKEIKRRKEMEEDEPPF